MRDTRREQPDRRHPVGQLQLLLEPYARGDVLQENHRAGGIPPGRQQRRLRRVDQQVPRFAGVARGQGHPIQGRSGRVVAPLARQPLRERGIEQGRQRPSHGGGVRQAVDAVERCIPAHDPIFEVQHDEPVVQRLDDVLVELANPVDLGRLDLQLRVETTVLDRGGDLRRDRRQQGDVLAAQRLAARLRPQREHRDGPFFRNAGHEIVDPLLSPERDLRLGVPAGGRGVVEQDRPLIDDVRTDARGGFQPRPRTGRAPPRRPERSKLPAGLRFHGRHHQHGVVDDQGLGHPGHESFGQSVQIEIAVQLPRKTEQRTPVVIPVTVVRAVEHRLNGVLHRTGQQDDHRRRQQGDDRVVPVRFVEEHGPRQPIENKVKGHHRGHGHGIDQPALDDHLDVTQAILDDGRRERQRNQAQRNRGHVERRRVEPERPRDRVTHDEGQPAQNRSPHDPPQLAFGRHRRHPPQGENHEGQSANNAAGQVRDFQVPDALDRGREHRRAGVSGQRHRLQESQRDRRGVDHRHDEAPQTVPDRTGRPLGKHQGEVHEQRREHQGRDRVRPVEHPVQPIQSTAEREGEHAEERHAEPEEMQRGLGSRLPESNRGADQQREHADSGQHEVQLGLGRRRRLQGDVDQAGLIEPQQRIVDVAGGLPGMEMLHHVPGGLHRDAVERQQHIPRLDPGPIPGLVRRNLRRGDAGRSIDPQHAVDQLVPVGPDNDVRGGETDEDGHQGDGQDRGNPRTPPLAPAGGQDASRQGATHFKRPGRRTHVVDRCISYAIGIPGTRAGVDSDASVF